MDRALIKAEHRAKRERELAGAIKPFPDKRYGVILADPPWRFEPWSRKTGMDRAADNHYPTMTLDEIANLPIADIAEKNCALFLWATVPMLVQALVVMGAWGFEYRSHVVWNKDRFGTGYWFRNTHELLLLGTRGKISAPKPGSQWPSIIKSLRLSHSKKPAEVYFLIDGYFPTTTKIELFARGKARKEWDAWGNEVEAASRKGTPSADEGNGRRAIRPTATG